MKTWNTLRVIQDDRHVSTLVLNRPERRNALNQETVEEVHACLLEMRGQKDLRVLVLTGEGSAFCAGADLKERSTLSTEQTRHHRDSALRFLELIDTFPVPVIAMVNGPAFAGGMEVALACDIRVVSEDASFALTEVVNAGSFPGAGGPVRLPKLIGRGRASLIVFTGRRFSAREAYEMGMVEALVPHDRLREATYALAREIAGNSPLGVRAAKQLIRQSNDLDVHSATDLSRALRDPLDRTRDYREGVTAWMERRKPNFTAE